MNEPSTDKPYENIEERLKLWLEVRAICKANGDLSGYNKAECAIQHILLGH